MLNFICNQKPNRFFYPRRQGKSNGLGIFEKKIMKRLTIIFLFACFIGHAQLIVQINSLPSSTPLADPIYVAGSFNGWASGNSNYILKPGENSKLSIELVTPPGNVSFKFTRGSWQTVEGNAAGDYRSNHSIQYQGGRQVVNIDILSWEDLPERSNQSTASDNVKLLKADFYIPQLNRNRRIWIYLPADYYSTSTTYPVVYLQDGQNVFDASRSFSGEWRVDETLDIFKSTNQLQIIAVAIENGGSQRLNEYSPWVNSRYGGGQGDEYMEFLVQTLKPFIDNRFRTKPQREHTVIAGSSMGGLISMYGAIEYQEIFGKAVIFSPAFWFSPEIYELVDEIGKEQRMKFYLLAGQQEDNGSVVNAIVRMNDLLVEQGFGMGELFVRTHQDGQHSEWYWAREFPGAIQWLFSSN